jgi:DNA-directed RNA polymerase specialized sigma subunit
MIRDIQTEYNKNYEQYKNLIFKTLKQYGNTRNWDDLVSCSKLALLKAMHTHDVDKSAFITWFFILLRKEVQNQKALEHITTSSFQTRHKLKYEEPVLSEYTDVCDTKDNPDVPLTEDHNESLEIVNEFFALNVYTKNQQNMFIDKFVYELKPRVIYKKYRCTKKYIDSTLDVMQGRFKTWYNKGL